jgi:hypothetical protein
VKGWRGAVDGDRKNRDQAVALLPPWGAARNPDSEVGLNGAQSGSRRFPGEFLTDHRLLITGYWITDSFSFLLPLNGAGWLARYIVTNPINAFYLVADSTGNPS